MGRIALVLLPALLAHPQTSSALPSPLSSPLSLTEAVNDPDAPQPWPPPVPGQFVARLRPTAPAARLAAPGEPLGPGLRVVRALRRPAAALATRTPAAPQFLLVAADPVVSADTALAQLANHPAVLYAEPNRVLRLCPASTTPLIPDDFRFAELWNLDNRGQTGGTPGADIDAPLAWRLTVGDPGVCVAIIDTGIDFFHPDLEANIWINPGEIPGNGIDDDGNGFIDDVHGYDILYDDSDPLDDQIHGSHVAGIVGAAGNNGIGTAGVAWRTSLMAVKAFNENGEATLYDVVQAIDYAVANNARILNASWMTPEKSRALGDAIAAAHSAGLVIVAAAGNTRTETIAYPAAYPESVTVAATDSRDRRSLFSSYGAHVTLAAPGESILSTVPNNRYEIASGTSMAAPHVAGIAALVLSQHPSLPNTDVEVILRNACDPLDTPEFIGLGRANAAKAVRAHPPFPVARLRVPAFLTGIVDLRGTASSPRFVSYALDYGKGVYPTTWTPLFATNRPVDDGALIERLATDTIAEGEYVFRLRVRDSLGQEASDRGTVTIRNVHLTFPMHNDVLRAGDLLTLEGTVFGPERTYTIEVGTGWRPTAWSATGIRLAHQGLEQVIDGPLGTWDTTTARPNEFYTLKLTARIADRVVGQATSQLVYLDPALRPGFPVYVSVPAEYSTNDWRQPTATDLDSDGPQEILIVEPGDSEGKAARLLVFEPDGTLRWSRTLVAGAPYSDTPVTGDLDGDGHSEVLTDVGNPGQLFAFRADGSTLEGLWPVSPAAHALRKSLADLDGDGALEVVALGASEAPADNSPYVLIVLDAQGHLLQRWPIPGCTPTVDVPLQHPASANLDDDPALEIVVGYNCSAIALFDLSRPEGPVWTTSTSGHVYGSPTIGDINGDGHPEIIVGLYDAIAGGQPGTRGGIAAFTPTGLALPGWPVRVEESFASTPALADFDGDGYPEIAATTWPNRSLHLLTRYGFELPGWPIGPITGATPLRSSPVLADLDADQIPDIVLACPGLWSQAANSGALGYIGGIKAWNSAAQPLDLNPRPDQTAIVIESSGGSRLKAAHPVLTDLDGNGKLDVVATSVEDKNYPPPPAKGTLKNRFTLYAWELAVPFAVAPWPMFQRDPQHSGHLPAPKPVNHPPTITPIPGQIVRSGSPFFPVELDRYAQDPDSPTAALDWTVTGANDLVVTMGPQHVLTVASPTPTWEGSEILRFVVRDPGGLTATNSTRFAAQADYNPPVATPDAARLLEDSRIELALLDNDSHPLGLSLELREFSRAQHGTLLRTNSNRVVYSPATNFFGTDSFTYIAADGADGMAFGRVTLEIQPVPDPPAPAPDQAITAENAPVNIDILANDVDPDGDPLQLLDFDAPANGSLNLTASNTLVYQPRHQWSGTDRFNYRVADPSGLLGEASVTLQVKPVNDPPTARHLAFSLNRNTQLDVFFDATDPENDTLTYRIAAGPAHGELWAYPAIATYYPAKGFVGTDSFTYTASDAEFTSPPATVTFHVLDANNTPVPQNLDLVTRTGRPLPITLAATDADGDPIAFAIVDPPAHGTLSGTNENLLYLPEPGFLGDDSFTFAARDPAEASALGTARLHVTDRNSAPIAQTYTLEIPRNAPTNVTLLALDGENDPLEFTVVTNPVHGQLSGQPPRLLFTPQSGYYGPDKLSFTVADDQFTSAPGTVYLWIYTPNQAPAATNLLLSALANSPTPIALPASDPDDNPLRTAILKGPRHGRVFGLGTNFTYLPNPGYTGLDQFTFKVWDGIAYSEIGEVTILVRKPDPLVAPRFEGVKMLEDRTVQFRVLVTPGRRLDLLFSTNASAWSPFSTLTPLQDTVTVIDTNAPTDPTRFYRAVNPP